MTNNVNYKNMLEATGTKFTDWEVVIPDKLYYDFNSPYPYPYYENWSKVANKRVIALLGSDTCQFCNYQNLTRLWLIKTKDSEYYTVVGSECWKKFDPLYQDSLNVANDMVYRNITDLLLNIRKEVLDKYFNIYHKLRQSGLSKSGYAMSRTLKDLDYNTKKTDIKKIVKHFTTIYSRGFFNTLKVSKQELGELFVLVNDKPTREYWLRILGDNYGRK